MTVLKYALAAVLLAASTGVATAQLGDFPRGTPDEGGFSGERLGRIGQVLNEDIDAGKIPGAVLAIARDGKLIYLGAFGYRDKAAGVLMTPDTIFNIASMTKPMTAVAALTLVEQGRLILDEPVAHYLPGRFGGMQVATPSASGETIVYTAPATRSITVRDLLTHTSGLIYGGRGTTAVHKLYPAGSAAAAETLTADEFLTKLSGTPLLHQPGTTWDYGFGLDVTGLIVEALTEQSLGHYLDETVFKPLGMVDTGFVIPAEKAARYAKALPIDPYTGRAQTVGPNALQPQKFECGGGCAVSTVADYLRFASMLLNDGEYGGRRILSPAVVRYMLSDQLGGSVRNLIGNADPTRAGYGFGLGLAVRTTPGGARLFGSVGDFSWPGASGTNWWVDPKERLVVVFMAHTPGPARWHYRYLINNLVYAAMER